MIPPQLASQLGERLAKSRADFHCELLQLGDRCWIFKREGDKNREKEGRKPILQAFCVDPNTYFHLCLHLFQFFIVSVTLSFHHSFSLPFLSFFAALCPLCLYLHPSSFPCTPLETSPLKYCPPSLTVNYSLPWSHVFCCHSLSVTNSFHLFLSVSALTHLCLSVYLAASPASIVVVVDYAVKAEDMSFLLTCFSAQHDYTNPSVRSKSLPHTVSAVAEIPEKKTHKQKFLGLHIAHMYWICMCHIFF